MFFILRLSRTTIPLSMKPARTPARVAFAPADVTADQPGLEQSTYPDLPVLHPDGSHGGRRGSRGGSHGTGGWSGPPLGRRCWGLRIVARSRRRLDGERTWPRRVQGRVWPGHGLRTGLSLRVRRLDLAPVRDGVDPRRRPWRRGRRYRRRHLRDGRRVRADEARPQAGGLRGLADGRAAAFAGVRGSRGRGRGTGRDAVPRVVDVLLPL